jgi:hypothetical protein
MDREARRCNVTLDEIQIKKPDFPTERVVFLHRKGANSTGQISAPVGPILLELGQCVGNLKVFTLMYGKLGGSANILDCRVLGTWGDIPR